MVRGPESGWERPFWGQQGGVCEETGGAIKAGGGRGPVQQPCMGVQAIPGASQAAAVGAQEMSFRYQQEEVSARCVCFGIILFHTSAGEVRTTCKGPLGPLRAVLASGAFVGSAPGVVAHPCAPHSPEIEQRITRASPARVAG